MAKKATEPVFKGERVDRTSGERQLCEACSELATHRAHLIEIDRHGQWPDVYFCNFHLHKAVKDDKIHHLAALPEYRLYVGRMKRWKAKQDAGNQGVFPL